MSDKTSPENVPNRNILIRVGVTPTDILPRFPVGHTEAITPENSPETLHKIGLSVRIEVLPERSATLHRAVCQNQATKGART